MSRRVPATAPRSPLPARVAVTVVTVLAIAGQAACGGPSPIPGATAASATDPSSQRVSSQRASSPPTASPLTGVPVAASTCSPGPTVSFAPLASTAPSAWPAGSLMQAITQRGYLVVGVSGDTRLLGARNALKGGRIEGFDIDMARQVAQALFGPDNVDAHLRFKVITAGQRIPLVNMGAGTAAAPASGVDMVARAMTMNCDRWTNPTARVAFSSVYLLAHQRLLIRAGSGVKDVADLQRTKATVCVPKNSTSLARIAQYPGIVPVPVEIHSDCLALWQEGAVDAITGDDAILAGFTDQDPHAVVVGSPLEDEPYGLAVAADHAEFARFINAVLEQIRGNGTWQRIYDTWLRAALPGSPATPPVPQYGR